MSARAKICGLSTPETVAAAVRHGASHIGFVFFPKSPRDIAPEQAGALAHHEHVARVGVFVDADDALLAHAIHTARLDAVQLHGKETPERAAAIRATHGVDVWKAVPVKTRADLSAARGFAGAATRILYDAKTPDTADLPGGMGLRFDWHLLDGFDHPLPWALSGGLDAGNVAEAIGITATRLVDVSSGVESAPGVKDVDKIARFLQSLGRS